MRFHYVFKILVAIRQAVQFATVAAFLVLFLHVAWNFTSTEPYDRRLHHYVTARNRLQNSFLHTRSFALMPPFAMATWLAVSWLYRLVGRPFYNAATAIMGGQVRTVLGYVQRLFPRTHIEYQDLPDVDSLELLRRPMRPLRWRQRTVFYRTTIAGRPWTLVIPPRTPGVVYVFPRVFRVPGHVGPIMNDPVEMQIERRWS